MMPHLIGYPYRLCSYFYAKELPALQFARLVETSLDGSEWIMDSGLFSFMFGAQKGMLKTFDDYKSYALTYLAAVNAWGWKHAIVECDVQRVLGVPETERLRDEVFRPSGHEVVYVWHIPEGEDGLARLAQREKRIALSVPELRQVLGTGPTGGLKVRAALIHLLGVIRKSGASPRVHLLGNTERSLVGLPADSCDSTSWNSGGRYGWGYSYDPAQRWLEQLSLYSPKWFAWRAWCEQEFAISFKLLRQATTTDVAYTHRSGNMCSAIAHLMLMEALSGQRMRLPPPTELLPCLMPTVDETEAIEEPTDADQAR